MLNTARLYARFGAAASDVWDVCEQGRPSPEALGRAAGSKEPSLGYLVITPSAVPQPGSCASSGRANGLVAQGGSALPG